MSGPPHTDTVCNVDPLSAFLDRGEKTAEIRVRGSWSVDLGVGSGLDLVAVAHGTAWCHRSDGDPLALESGDILVLSHTDTSRVLSASPEPPAVAFRSPQAPADLRIVGEQGPGGTRLFVRSFAPTEATSVGFVGSLAPEQVLGTPRDSALWAMLVEEADHLSVATDSAVTRLVDLIFIDALRRWVADGEAQGWMRAVLDPVVGAALRLFHGSPEHPWTLEGVADRVGTTRSSLSRRFQLLVGEPPMIYLRRWRLSRAATLIDEEGATVAAAARLSGFSDPFEFSAAFSKEFGVAPGRYRSERSAGSA